MCDMLYVTVDAIFRASLVHDKVILPKQKAKINDAWEHVITETKILLKVFLRSFHSNLQDKARTSQNWKTSHENNIFNWSQDTKCKGKNEMKIKRDGCSCLN